MRAARSMLPGPSSGGKQAQEMDDLTREVLAHIDRRELIDLASALIRIPSFKTEETPVALFLEEFFRPRGYDIDLQEIAEAIRRSGVRLAGDLVVAGVAGETQGGEGTHYLMARGLHTGAAVVAGPFGADNLVTVHSGIVHMAIHTYGVTGHIGRLEGTVNAVHKMTTVIGAPQHL
jgi:acetylornithine deacetylase/succinyl-diaminopimelate desuccinylase-like protein